VHTRAAWLAGWGSCGGEGSAGGKRGKGTEVSRGGCESGSLGVGVCVLAVVVRGRCGGLGKGREGMRSKSAREGETKKKTMGSKWRKLRTQ